MSRNNRRNSFIPSGFSIRRLLLQSARAAHGSPPIGQRSCDIEKGNVKNDKKYSVDGGFVTATSITTATSNSSSSSKNNDENPSQSTSIQLQRQNSQNPLQQDQATTSNITKNGLHHHHQPCRSLSSKSDITISSNRNQRTNNNDNLQQIVCPICLSSLSLQSFFTLFTCNHKVCRTCLEKYLKNEINESRTDIACPQCSEAMHPSNIEALLKDYPEFINKYEDFMVRRFLLSDPDSRWCPAPDCSYAVIASGCASCPRLRCQRPGCGLHFCYHCKAEWHPDQTCDAARASRQSPTRAPSGSTSQDSQHRDDIKPCPRCQVLIVKMDDGSCNHMVCSVCGTEFCWLCMKEINDLHYLSPSGCTFWGKKPWSRKKKLLWQLGILVGAPVGIALVAGIAVPAMIIGIPVWVGKKIYARYKTSTKHRRNCAVLGGVATSILISPVLAGLAVAIGVPILLFYVYGVVPVSLCRAGCGVSTTRDGFKFDFDDEVDNQLRNQSDGASADAVSRIGATSIGEVSLSVASGSHVGVSSGHNIIHTSNRESTTALAGSITGHRLEVQVDVSSSETASAVTCVSEKSGNTLNDTASTRALAGSILSNKQLDSLNMSEDGASEKVRFDNTVSYISDGKKEHMVDNSLDQEYSADKMSIDSSHSFRSSEKSYRDDVSLSAMATVVTNSSKQKHRIHRTPKLNAATHKALSLDSTGYVSDNIPENVSLEQETEEEMIIKEDLNLQFHNNNNLHNNLYGGSSIGSGNNECSSSFIDLSPAINASNNSIAATIIGRGGGSTKTLATTTVVSKKQQPERSMTKSNLSKSSILRSLFFSQQSGSSNDGSETNQQNIENVPNQSYK